MKEMLSEYFKSINIADEIDDKLLPKIGDDVYQKYQDDESDREEWLKRNEKGIELAAQMSKGATFAGEKAFDIMYPLISTASIQFAARAYPNIIKGADIVKTKKIGKHDSETDKRGARVARYMNYQLLDGIESWPEEMDQLLYILPVLGSQFKKTLHNGLEIISENVPAPDLVIPYNSTSLEKAPQITQILTLSKNDVISRQRRGIYMDGIDPVDLGYDDEEKDEQVFLEQHTWLDLDEDDYKEPYIVTIHKDTQKVMRITARYNPDGIHVTDKGEIHTIDPVHYYTRYLFMPAFDGSVYGMGFGSLLGPINLTINSVINQLLDSGALYSRQGGFLGKDIRLSKNQSMYFKTGEWKHMSYRGDDLRKNIVPLPTHEPSQVLFSLLGLMIEAGKEMASVSELLSGEQRQSNVPASTTLALIEQGLKVFSGIYMRINRSLKSEVTKIRDLDHLYLTDEEYIKILNEEASVDDDFASKDVDIIPVVDVGEITEIQRATKGKALLEMKGQGLDDDEINRRYLESIGIEDIEGLIPDEKPIDPKYESEVELLRAKARTEESQANLYDEKINTEIINQNATRAGVDMDRDKIEIERARTAKELITDDTLEKKGKNAEIVPTSRRRDQKTPFREVGIKSDNVRREEQSN